MIYGFERETHELNDYERDVLLPVVARGLMKKIGETNAVTNNQIIEGLKNNGYKKCNQARIRKIINFIRVNGIVKNLVASSKGYWIETDPIRRETYRISIYQRAQSMLAILKHIEE